MYSTCTVQYIKTFLRANFFFPHLGWYWLHSIQWWSTQCPVSSLFAFSWTQWVCQGSCSCWWSLSRLWYVRITFYFPFPHPTIPVFHYSCVLPFLWIFIFLSLGSSVWFPRSSVPLFLHFAVPPFRCSSISLFLRSNFFPLCSTLCFLSHETFFHWHYFPYSRDKFFPALGFGAKIPPGMQVCKQHIFFVCLFVCFFSFIIFFPLEFLCLSGGWVSKGKLNCE